MNRAEANWPDTTSDNSAHGDLTLAKNVLLWNERAFIIGNWEHFDGRPITKRLCSLFHDSMTVSTNSTRLLAGSRKYD